MRRIPFFALFLLCCFSLFGQTSREANIYVPPIDGYGRTKDNSYFFTQLIYEVILQYHTVVKTQRNSDYTLKGTIELVNGADDKPVAEESAAVQKDAYSPVPEKPVPPVKNANGRREFFSMDKNNEIYFFDTTGENNLRASAAGESAPSQDNTQAEGKEYFFILEITDSRTGEVLDNQSIIFIKTDDSVKEKISTVVYNMLSGISGVSEQNAKSQKTGNKSLKNDNKNLKSDNNSNEFLFFEIGALWMPRVYSGGYESINWLNFGVKLGLEFQFLKYFAVGAGAQITMDRIDVAEGDFRDLLLETPVSLKFVYNLGERFIIEPYGGAAWNYSLGELTEPSIFSWFAGLQFGIRAGSGYIIFDPRFSMDFYDSVLLEDNTKYQRYCMQFGVSYRYSIFQKKNKD